MKDVMIKIKGTQIYDKNKDFTEFTTQGKFETDDRCIKLYYEENEAIGAKGIKTELSLFDKRKMELIRKGEMAGMLTVEKGKRHSCLYNTPYGDFTVGVYGEEIEASVDDKGGKIYLSYTLDVNSGMLSRNIMEIEIKNLNS